MLALCIELLATYEMAMELDRFMYVIIKIHYSRNKTRVSETENNEEIKYVYITYVRLHEK
jgi:hypothetical protein